MHPYQNMQRLILFGSSSTLSVNVATQLHPSNFKGVMINSSCCLEANLGHLTEEAERRWRTWASKAFNAYKLAPKDGEWILVARRDDEVDVKTLQKTLRTKGSHWKMRIRARFLERALSISFFTDLHIISAFFFCTSSSM